MSVVIHANSIAPAPDANCFSRQGWRCYHALGGVLPRKTPQFKIGTDADFEPY